MTSTNDVESLLAPYFAQAKTFLQDVMDNLPDYVKDFVDDFEIAGTSEFAILPCLAVIRQKKSLSVTARYYNLPITYANADFSPTEAAAALQKELSALIALSEKRLTPFFANLKHSAWEAVRISGLAQVDENSRERHQGTKTVQAGIESVSRFSLLLLVNMG